MANINFSKLGLKKQSFEETFVFRNEKDEEFDIIVSNKISSEKQREMIKEIIDHLVTMDDKTIDAVITEVYTILMIVKYYTNIKFTDKQLEDCFKTYDLLEQNDLLVEILKHIAPEELDFINTAIKENIKSLISYNNSVTGILERVSRDYSNVKFDADEIAKTLGDPSQLDLVKKMLDNIQY